VKSERHWQRFVLAVIYCTLPRGEDKCERIAATAMSIQWRNKTDRRGRGGLRSIDPSSAGGFLRQHMTDTMAFPKLGVVKVRQRCGMPLYRIHFRYPGARWEDFFQRSPLSSS
jgi:hypothetical protein